MFILKYVAILDFFSQEPKISFDECNNIQQKSRYR